MVKSHDTVQYPIKERQNAIFINFQNACPRKWCNHFRWNSTELKYSMVLQTDVITASELFPISKFFPSEHSQKSWYPIMETQNVIFINFQNACPRKWCGHFRWNSTESKYYRVLQTDVVTASVLFPISKNFTSEHSQKSWYPIMEKSKKWPCSQVMKSGVEMSTKAITLSVCSTLG